MSLSSYKNTVRFRTPFFSEPGIPEIGGDLQPHSNFEMYDVNSVQTRLKSFLVREFPEISPIVSVAYSTDRNRKTSVFLELPGTISEPDQEEIQEQINELSTHPIRIVFLDPEWNNRFPRDWLYSCMSVIVEQVELEVKTYAEFLQSRSEELDQTLPGIQVFEDDFRIDLAFPREMILNRYPYQDFMAHIDSRIQDILRTWFTLGINRIPLHRESLIAEWELVEIFPGFYHLPEPHRLLCPHRYQFLKARIQQLPILEIEVFQNDVSRYFIAKFLQSVKISFQFKFRNPEGRATVILRLNPSPERSGSLWSRWTWVANEIEKMAFSAAGVIRRTELSSITLAQDLVETGDVIYSVVDSKTPWVVSHLIK